ncbi:MAG TPA: hypothetical protein VGE39_20145 [Prosthecobacter sp.]
MNDVSAPALQESLPSQGKPRRWLLIGGFALVVIVLAFLWMRSAQGAVSLNHEAGPAPCCVQ